MQGWLGRCAGRQEAPEYALHTARSKARTNAGLVHLNCCSETEKPRGYCLILNLGSSYCFGLSHPNLGHKTNFANEAPPGEKKQIQRLTLNEEQSCVVGLFMRGGSWILVSPPTETSSRRAYVHRARCRSCFIFPVKTRRWL